MLFLINLGNITMFERVCGGVEESEEELDDNVMEDITGYLESQKEITAVLSRAYRRRLGMEFQHFFML